MSIANSYQSEELISYTPYIKLWTEEEFDILSSEEVEVYIRRHRHMKCLGKEL